jgi:hypothetical protein
MDGNTHGLDNQNGRARYIQETERQNKQYHYIKHRYKILIGILIICGFIFFILFHERKDLLIALYVILYLLSPVLIYLLSRWEEAEEDKKTVYD